MSKITSVKTLLPTFLCLSLMLCIQHEATAQRFKGSAVAGINLAQIDGDAIYGYNKLGLQAGFKLDYPIMKKADISLEMLFSERGSIDGFGFGSSSSIYTRMRYLDLPISISVKDWYVEDQDYHKVSAHAGLNVGYLFDVQSTNGVLPGNIESYQQVDFSYFFGINYKFNRRMGLTIRHTRAFTDLLPSITSIGYYVTTRVEYYF